MNEQRNKILLQLARKAIQNKLEKGEFEEINIDNLDISDSVKSLLREKNGVFITIRKKGELRGCIGTISEDELWRQVQKYAVFSAFNDPRFEPIKPDELPEISIEISLIKDIEDVRDISEIKLGENGVILDLKGRGGVLLPDVVAEFGLKTPEEFLDMLCNKIGVPAGSWRKGIIKKFSAEKIVE
ncbi:MAG: AmmeMemoRadiSam system protein A [bacterium]|nr:AmmeMemoRadiSam system protein A [bacterium]